MKTEHHPASAHSQKAIRGGHLIKASDAPNAAAAKVTDGPGGFLSLLAQVDADQTSPASMGGDTQVPIGLSGSEWMGALDPDQASGAIDSADHSALLAQLGQGFVRPDANDANLATDKIELDPKGRFSRSGHGEPKGVVASEPMNRLQKQEAGNSQTDLQSVKGQVKTEGSEESKGINSKAFGQTKSDNLLSFALSSAHDLRSEKSIHIPQTAELAQLTVQAHQFGATDNALRQGERPAAKLSTAKTSDNIDGLWGSQTLFSGSPQGIEPTNPADAMVAPDISVAEQVKYWISHDIQNAELKIDGFDGLPVDVSITLKGNEASVDFRTDQEGIREILQNTESHLKEVLAREGLVLSGVSIGASMQQGERETPQGREPDAKRRIELKGLDSTQIGNSRQPSSVAGKSIDVFV